MKSNWTLLTGWLLALLPGIAGAADPMVAPKDSAPKKGDPAGYVCGTFSQQRSGPNRVIAIGPKIWLTLQREGGTALGRIGYGPPAFRAELDTSDLTLVSFCGALIPGRYRLIRGELEFIGAGGVAGGAVFTQGNSKFQLPILGGEIVVADAEMVYVGNFNQYSIDRYTYYVVVSDQLDRDMVFLRKKFPKLSFDQMRRAIVDVDENPEGFQFLREPE